MKYSKHFSKMSNLVLAITVFGMIGIAVVPLLIIKHYQSLTIQKHSSELVDTVVAEGQGTMDRLMVELITQKADAVSGQLQVFLNNGGKLGTSNFDNIAVQRVMKRGYTAVYDCKTGVMLAHPNPALVGRNMRFLEISLPSWWKIFKPSLSCQDASGFYDWLEPDGLKKKKYMFMKHVPGSTLTVAATIYLDEFHHAQDGIHAVAQEQLGETRRLITSITDRAVIISSLIAILFIAIVIYGRWAIWRRFFTGVDSLIAGMEEGSEGEWKTVDIPVNPWLQGVVDKYNQLVLSAREIQGARMRNALADAASQVAHDIRSPLTALQVVTRHIPEVAEEKRVLIRNAVQRIDDIANDLANHATENDVESDELDGGTDTAPELLSSLIEPLISEKRIQHRAKRTIQIEAEVHDGAYGIFAQVNAAAFRRALSNLVNNSVEAIHDTGVVSVQLCCHNGHALVQVKDDGCGIPAAVMPQLLHRGASFGKTDGSGLGLSYARDVVESWGGTLQVSSEEGRGTCISIRLPKAPKPQWFVEQVLLRADRPIVVLDDDVTIHQVWQARFDALQEHGHQLEVYHCSSAKDLRSTAAPLKDAQYFCDYELLGEDETGLDLIEELGLAARATLVTSRYAEHDVRERCARLGVQLLPKGLAGIVPVCIAPAGGAADVQGVVMNGKARVLVIDDDEGIRLAWSLEQERFDIAGVDCFASMEACEAAGVDYASYSHVMLDKNIPDSAWSVRRAITHLKIRSAAKVIIASGELQAALESDASCVGADGYLSEKIPSDDGYFE